MPLSLSRPAAPCPAPHAPSSPTVVLLGPPFCSGTRAPQPCSATTLRPPHCMGTPELPDFPRLPVRVARSLAPRGPSPGLPMLGSAPLGWSAVLPRLPGPLPRPAGPGHPQSPAPAPTPPPWPVLQARPISPQVVCSPTYTLTVCSWPAPCPTALQPACSCMISPCPVLRACSCPRTHPCPTLTPAPPTQPPPITPTRPFPPDP